NPAFTNFASFSSGGPRTGDSGLKPSVTAPGVSIMSAEVGTGSGGYFNSGTSMAAPQVAGVAALNVQAHPGWSAEAISANLVNTADPSKVGNYRLTLGGAGLVDVAQSVDNTVTAVSDPFETTNGSLQEPSMGFGFAESTTSFTGTKKITLTNHGTSAKTYAVAAQPSPQTVPATVKFSTKSVTVPAGGSATVDVTLRVDMTKVGSTLASLHAFYEASGSVVFSGDSELRVPYLLVPRAEAKVDAKLKGNLNSKAIANKNSPMKVDVEVTNRGGAIDAVADFYTLGLTDPQGDVPLAGHPGTDLRALGVQSFADGDDQLLVFAVNTWDRYSNAARNETGVDVDVDNDGTTDWTVFSVDSGLVRSGSVNGVNEVFLAEAGGGLYAAGFYASSPTDNSTVLLPVYAADLGITAEKGTFAYTGYVSSIADSAANDAFEGKAHYNPWKPALSNGQYVDVAKGNAKQIATVAIDRAEFAAQKPGGVMVVALDNKAGADEAILLLAK
ncbi:MAG TPA: S8 family serine peptidase, partial [Propionibacterium sp.]|nr:S8 family serine peptidase [Propionibacterium sp.]